MYKTKRSLCYVTLGGKMQHCCKFKADDVYYLDDTTTQTSRYLSIGFCPLCGTPVAELCGWQFDGVFCKQKFSGVEANSLLLNLKDEIVYSVKELNYKRSKTKPFGWRYGINKAGKTGGKITVRQYACDFYGNKELIKTI